MSQDLKETEKVKCASCGADMVFSPETQTLFCEHCGNTVEIRKVVTEEQDFFSAVSGNGFRADIVC